MAPHPGQLQELFLRLFSQAQPLLCKKDKEDKATAISGRTPSDFARG
jgi:hypothetical protein